MNLPNSVVRHVLSTVALIFRSMTYIPERFADHCNDRRLTEGQLLRRASVKRKPCVIGRAECFPARGVPPTRYPAGGATRRARARPLASRARGIVAQSAPRRNGLPRICAVGACSL